MSRNALLLSWVGVLLAGGLLAMPARGDEGQEEKEKKDEQGEEIKVTEEGIEFKDESGKTVQIGDFEQISLEQLLVEPVVTTGGKREQVASASVSTISILTKEDMQLMPYFYLGEMLSVLPGMDIRWGKMQKLYVGIRGLGGTALNSRLLLLWNGLPHNDPFTGELLGGHFMPIMDIERVEVIRGPGSTLYGANAFSGVVNVITSTKEDVQNVDLNVLAGSQTTVRAYGGANRKVGPVQVGGTLEFLRTDGPFPASSRFMEAKMVTLKNDDVRSVGVGAHVQYKGLRLEGRFVDGERGLPGTLPTDGEGNLLPCSTCHNAASPFGQGIKYPATPNSCGQCHFQPDDREYVRRGSVALRFDQPLSAGFRLSANAYHNEWRTTFKTYPAKPFLAPASAVSLDNNRRTSGVDINVSHTFRKLNTVVLGGEFRRYEAASQVLFAGGGNDATEIQGSVYAEDEFHPIKWFSVTGGVRYDYSSLLQGSFAPRGGVIFTPIDRLAIKGTVGRAFRNPSLAELYVYDTRGRYSVEGNSSLKPEWITNFEGGAYYTFIKPVTIRLGGTFFYSMINDLVAFRAESIDRATFLNVKSNRAYGVEAEVEVEVTKKPNIKLMGNYSFQRTSDPESAHLSYAPEHKFNVALFGRYGRFGSMVRTRFLSERFDDIGVHLPKYLTLDAALMADVWGGLNMALWAINLTGSDHQESLGIPSAGRSFFFSVGYKYQ